MIKPAEKVNIIFHKENRIDIFKFIQDKEIIELVKDKKDCRDEEKKAEILERKIEVDTKLAETEYAINFLSQHQFKRKKIPFKEKMQGLFSSSKIYLAEKTVEKKAEKVDLPGIVLKCKKLEARLNELNNLIEELTQRKRFNERWRYFPYRADSLKELRNLKMFVCRTFKMEELKVALRKESILYEIREIPESNFRKGNLINFCLFYDPKIGDKIKNVLENFDIEPNEEAEQLKNFPKKEASKTTNKLKIFQKEKKNIIRTINELFIYHERDLRVVYDYLNWKGKRMDAVLKSRCMDSVFSVKGWIDQDRIKELKDGLSKITDNFEIFILKAEEGDRPPVIVKRNSFLNPVESVMNLYGTPKEDEVDPLPLMAPFFILFFAICLGDVGYGILMFLLSFLAIKVTKIPMEKSGLLYLLMNLGIASCVTGVLFGGWFGIDLESLSEGSLKSVLLLMKIADPIKDPIQILFLALGLGVIQIIFSLCVKTYSEIKLNGKKEGLLGTFPWIYFMISLVFFVASSSGIIFGEVVFKYLVLSGVLFLILTQGRKSKNYAMKALGGITSLYGLVGYFSDVVSYSRLLALGLSTGVIAAVVNLIAEIVKDMIPVVGAVLAIFVLIFGHMFNLLISGFGAFIHSMRLQFVEFLPKFMAGGGKKFNPFKREEKYVEINSGNN